MPVRNRPPPEREPKNAVPTARRARSSLSDSNARLVAARRLTSRRARRDSGLFLAEGAQSVRAALEHGSVVELFASELALGRNVTLAALAERTGVPIDVVSAKAAAGLSETSSPQGIVAVCRQVGVEFDDVLRAGPRLVAALVEANDPGNAGTVVRTADAAGADAVVFVGGVDPHNGKTVRASAGSLFQLAVVIVDDVFAVLDAAADAGLQRLATSPAATCDLDALAATEVLRRPTLWLFGSEAHGLPDAVSSAADRQVRVPIYGPAESLNLAVAAGLCLYASAREQRKPVAGA